jgi:hypothetical protein
MFDPSPKYDTITVSNAEIYQSIRELKGKQTTHAETNFEAVEEGQSETESVPSSPVVRPASSRQVKRCVGDVSHTHPHTHSHTPQAIRHSHTRNSSPPTTLPFHIHHRGSGPGIASGGSAVSPAPSAQQTPSPQPQQARAELTAEELSELQREQMNKLEEARRAAAFSKRVSGRRKSTANGTLERNVKGFRPINAQQLKGQVLRRGASTSSEEEGSEGSGSASGSGSSTEDEDSSDGGVEESKELSNAQFNEIMDTLAAQPTAQRPSKFMTAPSMVWGTYFPQPGLHNAALSMSAAWHSVQGRRTVRACVCQTCACATAFRPRQRHSTPVCT